jgi:hypothetical protein
MMHSLGDENGASSSFFWVQPNRALSVSERHSSSIISKMNNRFSLFAHVVEGNDVMDLLRPGDVLLSADVKEGEGSGMCICICIYCHVHILFRMKYPRDELTDVQICIDIHIYCN